MSLEESQRWQKNLSIVIPAFNEEEGLPALLTELLEKLPQAEIIVVDDCSSDKTAETAERFPLVRLMRHRTNRGYGASLKTGMRAATRRHVAWIDADGEYAVSDLIIIAKRIQDEDRDAILTHRRQRSRSLVRFVGKRLIRTLAQSLSSDHGQDGNSGLRVFKTRLIRRYLSILPDGFSASMTSTIVMYERNHDVAIQSIDSHPRVGVSKVKLKDGFATLALVMRLIMLFAPLRIFLRSGAIFLCIGLVYGLTRAILERHGIPIAGALIMLAGLLLWMLGLIADQISQIRLAVIEMQSDADDTRHARIDYEQD